MPIVKDIQAQPMLKDAVVLDLGDIAREGKRLREEARAEAARIIEQAQQRASALTQNAAAQGHQQGYEQGKSEGYAQGQNDGQAEALATMSEKLEVMTAAWTDLASQWNSQRQQMHREAKQSVLDLALALSEKIVKQHIEANREVIVEQLTSALGSVLEPGDVTIHIHPDDRPTLDAALPKVIESFANLDHVHLSEDPDIQPGGCVIHHGQGRIDATIDTQLQRITERL